jgi:2-polyprenyl-3-methyl-5-hydroxy-6-metoxy-1,4-benzoquinol methylase
MNYREKLYSTYVSSHTKPLYGEAILEGIKKQYPVWKRYFKRFLPDDKDAKILDIGCGNGGFVYYLKNLGYRNSSGIDISLEQVEAAKKLGIKDVECADAMSFLKDKKELYDLIVARDLLEHFTKDEIMDVLSLTFNSLKLGGPAVIQAPNAQNLFSGILRYGDFTHEIAFTKDSLNQILRAAGFNEVAFYPTGPVPKGIRSAIRFVLWKMIEKVFRFYMLIEAGSSEGIFTQNIIAVAKK